MSRPATPVPGLTRSRDQALQDLRTHGIALLAGAIDGATCARARQALYTAAADDRVAARETVGFALDTNNRNQRVWNLLNRDPIFAELAAHPLALYFVRQVLGWPALLSNISGNIAGPGATAGVLHADQLFVPQPWPAEIQGINTAWCLDALTSSNGATEVVPGSHLWHRPPTSADAAVRSVPLLAPAGTLCVFESRLWHRSGANSRDERRAVVFPFYTRTIYRTQENWFLSLNQSVLDSATDEMLALLAYKTEGFGLVNGRSPR